MTLYIIIISLIFTAIIITGGIMLIRRDKKGKHFSMQIGNKHGK